MEALHDVVRAGKARYIGASAMYAYAWQFLKALNVAEKNGWTLLYRREMMKMEFVKTNKTLMKQ